MNLVQPERQVTLSARNAIILMLGMIITAVIALGSHDLAIAHLGIPYPHDDDVPEWARYIGQIVRLAAMVYICRLASWYLDRRNILQAAAIFGLLIVLLQESLRAIVVDNIVSDGWIDRRWLGLLMARLPSVLLSFYSGAIAVVIARKIGSGRPFALASAVAIASAVGYFALQPALAHLAEAVPAALHLAEAPEVHKMPYDLYIYAYIYGMFIEPTIAAFALIYLMWPALSGSKLRRVGLFVLLLLLVRGRVVATGLYSFWIKDSLPMAFAAEGQFFVETLLLAALTGLTWSLVTPNVSEGRSDAT